MDCRTKSKRGKSSGVIWFVYPKLYISIYLSFIAYFFLFYHLFLKMLASSKSFFLFTILSFVFIQTAFASIYSQLQFIKIVSPKNGDDVEAGKPLVVKYTMQPLISGESINRWSKGYVVIVFALESVSAGKALKLNINFHKRTGNSKQQKVAIIHKSW